MCLSRADHGSSACGVTSLDLTQLLCAQVLYNTAPTSYTASCTPVTNVQVGQSVIPPGTNISTTIVPPAQVTLHAQLR